MNRTTIDWAEYSWNPVTGCAGGCDYCYARRIAERFGGPDGFKPTLHEERLPEPGRVQKPSRIFVGSMCDLFGDWVPNDWIYSVLATCEMNPQHQYLFLTKNPMRYEQLFCIYQHKIKPHANWWLGATFDTANDTSDFCEHLWSLHESGWHTWASAEPLLEDITENMEWNTIDWLVIGAMTGPGSKGRQPEFKWTHDLTSAAVAHGIPVFHKRSMLPYFGTDGLIQQYPKAMTQEVTV